MEQFEDTRVFGEKIYKIIVYYKNGAFTEFEPTRVNSYTGESYFKIKHEIGEHMNVMKVYEYEDTETTSDLNRMIIIDLVSIANIEYQLK